VYTAYAPPLFVRTSLARNTTWSTHSIAVAPRALDRPAHRGVASVRERRGSRVPREQRRGQLVHQRGQRSLGPALAHEQRYAALGELARELGQRVEQERGARLRAVAREPRVEHEHGEPLLGAPRERVERRVVGEPQVVAEPVQTARHAAFNVATSRVDRR
jgi:hypothetical protein